MLISVHEFIDNTIHSQFLGTNTQIQYDPYNIDTASPYTGVTVELLAMLDDALTRVFSTVPMIMCHLLVETSPNTHYYKLHESEPYLTDMSSSFTKFSNERLLKIIDVHIDQRDRRVTGQYAKNADTLNGIWTVSPDTFYYVHSNPTKIGLQVLLRPPKIILEKDTSQEIDIPVAAFEAIKLYLQYKFQRKIQSEVSLQNSAATLQDYLLEIERLKSMDAMGVGNNTLPAMPPIA